MTMIKKLFSKFLFIFLGLKNVAFRLFRTNNFFDWVQVITHTGTYTCPTKMINGELFFKFKKEWHKVSEYLYKK